jgi:hypothetical protein
MKSIHKNFVDIRNFNYEPFDPRDINESKLDNIKKINKKISKEVSCDVRWDLIDGLVKEAFIDRMFALASYLSIKFKYFNEITKY